MLKGNFQWPSVGLWSEEEGAAVRALVGRQRDRATAISVHKPCLCQQLSTVLVLWGGENRSLALGIRPPLAQEKSQCDESFYFGELHEFNVFIPTVARLTHVSGLNLCLVFRSLIAHPACPHHSPAPARIDERARPNGTGDTDDGIK